MAGGGGMQGKSRSLQGSFRCGAQYGKCRGGRGAGPPEGVGGGSGPVADLER